MTYAPAKIPTAAPGQTYAPGMYPTWLPGMLPTVPTDGKDKLQVAKRTRVKFPETWIWNTVISGYVLCCQLIPSFEHFARSMGFDSGVPIETSDKD